MNRYEKIRQEIELIEKELKELRSIAGIKQMEGSLRELSLKNARIKSAFSSLSAAANIN